MITTQKGDIMDYWREGHAIGITTNGFVKKNGEAVMGRGIAQTVRDTVPGFARELGKHLTQNGNTPVYFPDWRIYTFPVKHNWWETADINLIDESFSRLLDNAPFDLHFVRPGCGNGKLDWSDVEPVLRRTYEDYWDRMQNKAIDVYVWSF
jgi:hypothetical protein